MVQVVEIREHKSRRLRWILRGVIPASLLVLIASFRNPIFYGNFGVVDPQLVYRSAQPDEALPRVIKTYGLRSILNMRGGSPANPWYAAEVRATREGGVDFYDLPMSATRRPRRRELLLLLDLFERCRYPLLIHCKSGSDRTGLATALYHMSRNNESPDLALRGFSLRYAHIPFGGPEHLHEPIEEYRDWLKARGLDHRPEYLRRWVSDVYDPDDPDHNVPILQSGPRKQPSGTSTLVQP